MARTSIRAPWWTLVLALLLVGTACSEPEGESPIEHDPNCGHERDSPFAVEGEPLTGAGLDELEEISDEAGLVWAELDADEQCALACVYMADELDHYFEQRSTVDEGCVLALEYEDTGSGPLLVGSDVTCSGVFRYTVLCL